MEIYFLPIRDGCIFYKDLEPRMTLVRRRQFSNKVGLVEYGILRSERITVAEVFVQEVEEEPESAMAASARLWKRYVKEDFMIVFSSFVILHIEDKTIRIESNRVCLEHEIFVDDGSREVSHTLLFLVMLILFV